MTERYRRKTFHYGHFYDQYICVVKWDESMTYLQLRAGCNVITGLLRGFRGGGGAGGLLHWASNCREKMVSGDIMGGMYLRRYFDIGVCILLIRFREFLAYFRDNSGVFGGIWEEIGDLAALSAYYQMRKIPGKFQEVVMRSVRRTVQARGGLGAGRRIFWSDSRIVRVEGLQRSLLVEKDRDLE